MKAVHGDWGKWLFFFLKAQKATQSYRHMKEQGNMAQEKEQDKYPGTNSKEIKLYELPD